MALRGVDTRYMVVLPFLLAAARSGQISAKAGPFVVSGRLCARTNLTTAEAAMLKADRRGARLED